MFLDYSDSWEDSMHASKYAASRLDKEVAAGRIQYSDVLSPDAAKPASGFQHWRAALTKPKPAGKAEVRAALASPAERSAVELEKTRRLNSALTRAGIAAPEGTYGEGVTVINKLMPGMGPATIGIGGRASVHTTPGAGGFMRQATAGRRRDVFKALAGTMSPRFLPTPVGQDASLGLSVLHHELGEASEFGKDRIAPHASHMGVEPLVRERFALSNDPEAFKTMHRIRGIHPDDELVQKAMRQVGATPGAPIPIGGKAHRALDRILSRKGKELTPQARGVALRMGLGGKEVSYMPKSVIEDVRGNIKGLLESPKVLDKLKSIRGLISRSRKYTKLGI